MIVTIENQTLKASISTMGATLMSFILKDLERDVVLGFGDEKKYLEYYDPHLGANVGRNANRIGKGQYKVNGKIYQASINNGPNDLHSGVGDLSFRNYHLKEKTDDKAVFFLHDDDGNGGFPGNLDVTITYELVDQTLKITYTGLCDQDSIFNMTNHSYFNLDEKGDIREHELKIFTDRVALNDENGMASDHVAKVEGTSFDFREYTKFKDAFEKKHDNLANGGIDHNFVFETLENKKLCTLQNKDLRLDISSDLPGLQVYTGSYLPCVKGKNMEIKPFAGVALEAQYYPNSYHYDNILKPYIDKDKEVKHFIAFELKERNHEL